MSSPQIRHKKLLLSLLLMARLRQGFGGQALVIAGVFGAWHGTGIAGAEIG